MYSSRSIRIDHFFLAGISYKNADAAIRGQFTINENQYVETLKLAPQFGLDALFILSTCNRIEIYGFADSASQLIDFLCTQTIGDAETFTQLAYRKQGAEAILHLFKVSAGLDSQILGDYEIVGQLKQAVKFARDRNFINTFLERLINSALQASKSVKNNTALSGGTLSTSYAVIQCIRENLPAVTGKKILLIGTGKIGRNTCKNLVDYLGTTDITLINRTDEKASQLASDFHLRYAPMAYLSTEVAAAEIIITATNAAEPILLKNHLEKKGDKLVIDLSVPCNLASDASCLPNVKVVNVDALSKIKDESLQKRSAETPKALKIITEHQINFMEWCRMHQNSTMLQSIKAILHKISVSHEQELKNPHTRCPYIAADQKIQRAMNSVATKMRNQPDHGCYFIEAINEYFNVVTVK